jgi:hypothetical protein
MDYYAEFAYGIALRDVEFGDDTPKKKDFDEDTSDWFDTLEKFVAKKIEGTTIEVKVIQFYNYYGADTVLVSTPSHISAEIGDMYVGGNWIPDELEYNRDIGRSLEELGWTNKVEPNWILTGVAL